MHVTEVGFDGKQNLHNVYPATSDAVNPVAWTTTPPTLGNNWTIDASTDGRDFPCLFVRTSAPTDPTAATTVASALASATTGVVTPTDPTAATPAATAATTAAMPAPDATNIAPTATIHGGNFNLDNAQKIFSVYNNGYAPPNWILTDWETLLPYLDSARIYYDGDINDAKKLAKNREPVNLGMSRLYNQIKLNELFGYQIGEYTEGSQNIAIYTHTPVRTADGTDLGKSIHIIHAIAPALDAEDQADYIEISKLQTPVERQQRYKLKLRRAFQKINRCFVDHKFTTLVMAGIGQGAFATYADTLNIDNRSIFNELFTEFFGTNNNVLMNFDNWVKVGNTFLKDMNPSRYIKNNLRTHKWLDTYTQTTLDKTLFVNAWDHLSMLGNGNNYDDTADGFYGRISAISVIGWPLTNMFLQKDDHYTFVDSASAPHKASGLKTVSLEGNTDFISNDE
jgi:hypothetical protein